MNKNYALKLTIISFFICVVILVITGCSNHKLDAREAEQNVKTFLYNKYGQDFTVNVIEYNKADYVGVTLPTYFKLEAISNGEKYNVFYENNIKYYSWTKESEDIKYPNSNEKVEENIEGRDWNKEISDYYAKRIGEYCSYGYLKELHFVRNRTPSKVGMTAEEYLDELFDYSAPSIYIDYAIFVDNTDSVRANNNVLKKIDDGIRRKPGDSSQSKNLYPHDTFFQEHFLIVSKKDKEEYIKKVEEHNKLDADYYGNKMSDEYAEKVKPLDDWFKKAEQDSCIVEHNNIGPNPNEVVQNWRKK
ncbi:hypothetical protein [Clostridium diolis]|uniref:DUF4825 domain-containing protein n=1 Tax=Clostridium diolis TaxID=223919 RepID=A0AAV3W782_9CLOT|nr:hypothetical protein [Clostridium diolis]QES74890.1 hypothetical protein F3K33_19645 [Clostridium diolis]GEA34034.1 hypothetical protein CDIOL_49570 [Clostridium diolis]